MAEGVLTSTDFVECYQSHYRPLVRALRLAGADSASAEDLAQEAFGRALARWHRVSRGANPPGYVYTVAFRLLQRTQRRIFSGSGARGQRSRSAAETTEDAALTTVAVESTLAAMPPRRRMCAVMCLVIGLPVREVAAALGIADGTVRKHLEEARRDLRAACVPPG
jgi:RNA polymerase sigma-70 factor, ECF subfamily